ncbi:MAG TPA: TetR/AcrR family transcriptional regulator [Terracidiphilus sp.]|jgi:TetR/AcrR family transcriptional regulator
MPSNKPNSLSSERSAETRQRILDAALREFAANGLAGARTGSIASAAGVNKALLYYYFDSKEKLYLAALEMISERVRDISMAVFLREASPGERVLRSAISHFDRILAQQEFQSLMQQEMIRLHKGETGVLPILIKRVFEPVMIMFKSMVREGIASGELINVDWEQMQLSALGANVMYFLTAPVWRLVFGNEPLTPEALGDRRKVLLEYLGQAIFQDRKHGAELAAKVYADTPMPEVNLPNRPGEGKLAARVLADAPRPEIWNQDAKERTK